MMRKSRNSHSLSFSGAFLIWIVSFLLGPTAVQAGLVNGSFESGDTSGWKLGVSDQGAWIALAIGGGELGPVDPPFDRFAAGFYPRPAVVGSSLYLAPAHGNRFLSMMGTAWRDLDVIGPDGLPYFYLGKAVISLTQSISLRKGDTVSGQAAFGTMDYPPYVFDASWVEIRSNGSAYVPIRLNVADAFDGQAGVGITPWMRWSWTAPEAGVYDLSLNVRGDDEMESWGLFDDISVRTVPEPSTMLLLGIGMFPYLATRRLSRKA